MKEYTIGFKKDFISVYILDGLKDDYLEYNEEI